MKVYLAGAIFGQDDEGANGWRDYARKNLRCEVLDPMTRDYRGVEDANVHNIVHQDLRDIDESDLVLANCVKPSWGTAMEVYYAATKFKRVPVLAVVPDGRVSPWLRHYTTRVFANLEKAIWTINEMIGGA